MESGDGHRWLDYILMPCVNQDMARTSFDCDHASVFVPVSRRRTETGYDDRGNRNRGGGRRVMTKKGGSLMSQEHENKINMNDFDRMKGVSATQVETARKERQSSWTETTGGESGDSGAQNCQWREKGTGEERRDHEGFEHTSDSKKM